MMFSQQNINFLPPIYFRNEILEWVREFRYLGLTLESKLSFRTHVNHIVNKAATCQGMLYTLSRYVSQKSLISIYYTLMFPHLTYQIIIWGGICPTLKSKIMIAVNKILRAILKVRFDMVGRPLMGTTVMYKRLSILKFEDIYTLNILKFIHSIIYGQNQSLFEQVFVSLFPGHNYNTRVTDRLNVPKIRLEIERQSTDYNIVKIFNETPNQFLIPQTIRTLKINFKTFKLQEY